ncbi:MAG: N-acetylmuramoyl-L-alanine amidase [Lachnospiraceae bacterium]|nr:N-acetylmuramoyl-L-alanine amidase [Lachnospiraceae bacterium]
MEPTIIIDAGHGGYDNGATFEGRREKDDNLRLALAVGERLQQEGFPVIFTRTTDVYQRPIDKATIANESGGDYFVSFHRNASPNANTYSGVQTLVYNDSGVPAQLARSINEQLSGVGFQNLGVSVRPNLVVLRRTSMPAVLVEAGFINTEADNQIFDENFDEMVNAIATGIKNVVSTSQGEKAFGVQIGLYRRYENAEYALNQVMSQGYDAQIREWKDYYAVVVGNVSTLEAARTLEQQLSSLGYDTLIVNL